MNKFKVLLGVAMSIIFISNLMSMMVSYDVTHVFGHRAIPVVLFCMVIIGLTTVGLHVIYEAMTNRDFDTWRPLKNFGAILGIFLGVIASITLGSHGVFVFSKYNEIQKQELTQLKHGLKEIKEKKDTIVAVAKTSYENKVAELKELALTELNDRGAGPQYRDRVAQIEKFMNGTILPLPNPAGLDINSKAYKNQCILQLNSSIDTLKATWRSTFDARANGLTKTIDSDEHAVLLGDIEKALTIWDWDDWSTGYKAKSLLIKASAEYSNMALIVDDLKKYSRSANKVEGSTEQIQVKALDNPPASVVLSKWTEYWRHGVSGFQYFKSLDDKPTGMFYISIFFALVFEVFYIMVFVAFYRQRSF